MKIALLIVIGVGGFALVLRGFIRNIREIRAKPPGSHSVSDKVFNYPLLVLWYCYLMVFFVGLIVNNTIFK